MKNIYLKKDDITDIDKIDEYNNEYKKAYPDFIPFVTKDNFEEFLKNVKDKEKGINNNGIKEVYYWLMENNKIIGSGSIRLNPEKDKNIEMYCGHIQYQIIPSKRGKGYGTKLCHLLINEMAQLGFNEITITCDYNNIASAKIIESNNGVLIRIISGDGECENTKTKIYKVNVLKSLENFNK